MPDLTRGHTFTSGEEVDHTKLNNLTGNATINNLMVTEAKLAASAVTNAKVSSTAAIALSKLASGTDGQIPICSATGVPTYVTLTGATVTNAGVVSLDANSVDSDQYVDGSIDTAHLADDAVTAGKLDDLLTDSGGTAAAYTNASITVDATGRVSAASSGSGSPAGYSFLYFTSNGTWTKPTGALLIRVVAVGGGGGANSASPGPPAPGGDGGAICDWIDVSSVSSVAVTIGAGGAGGTGAPGPGLSGGNTLFGSYLTANGGGGGTTAGGGADGTISGSQTSAEVSSGLVTTSGDGGVGASASGITGAVVVQVMG